MGEHNLPDHIDHPVHYTQGIECIDYILSHNMDYLEGNIVKYVTRYKFKHGVDDLRKAEWYLKRLLKREAIGIGPAVTPDNSWPSSVECAKPLVLNDNDEWDIREWEREKEHEWDLREWEREKEQEMAKETLQTMRELDCRSQCDNYIKPHFPKVRHTPWLPGTEQLV